MSILFIELAINGFFDIHDAKLTGDGIEVEHMSKEGYYA